MPETGSMPGMLSVRRVACRMAGAVAATLALLAVSLGAQAKTTLTVVGHWGGWQLQEFTKNAQEYMEVHPETDIQFIFSPMDRYEGVGKVLVMLGGNTAPDIIHTYLALTPELLDGGVFGVMPRTVAEETRRFFIPQVLPGVSFQGQLYGIPTENQTYVLAYNRRLLDEAGLAGPPATLQELRTMAGKLTRRSGDGKIERYGFTMDAPGSFIQFTHDFLTFLWSNGGAYIEEGQVRLNEPPAAGTVRFLSELMSSNFMRLGGGMGDGRSAMAIAPPWWRQGMMGAQAADYANLRTALMPVGAGPRVTYQYGWGLFVTAASPRSKEAWDFLRWLTMERGPKGTTRMGDHMVQLGSLPTNRLDIERQQVFRTDPFYRGFIESLDVARPEPVLPQISLRQSELANALGPAVQGQIPVATALEQAQQRITTILTEAKTRAAK